MLTTAYVKGNKIAINDYVKEDGIDALCHEGHKLIAKKGKKVVHHFAHAAGQMCDPWLAEKGGMTRWHRQWQEIVEDKRFLEVCIDEFGTFLGYSSFAGGNTVAKLGGHIADAIRWTQGMKRCSIIEFQHSSISSESIAEREKFYKDMIWVFDITDRVSKKKHVMNNNNVNNDFNKIVMVDGKLTFLKQKVQYVAVIETMAVMGGSAVGGISVCQQFNDFLKGVGINYSGYEDFELSGTFVIFNTKTKYWFDANKPVYFDAGYFMLRLIKLLDNGNVLCMILSYQQFFIEEMPNVNYKFISELSWFNTINTSLLISNNILPKPIKVDTILVTKRKVQTPDTFIVDTCKIRIKGMSGSANALNKGTGNIYTALDGCGLERGNGEYYSMYNGTVSNKTPNAGYIFTPLSSVMTQQIMTNGVNNGVNFANGTGISSYLAPINTFDVSGTKAINDDDLLISRIRTYMKISKVVNIEITKKGNIRSINIYLHDELRSCSEYLKNLGFKIKNPKGSIDKQQSGKDKKLSSAKKSINASRNILSGKSDTGKGKNTSSVPVVSVELDCLNYSIDGSNINTFSDINIPIAGTGGKRANNAIADDSEFKTAQMKTNRDGTSEVIRSYYYAKITVVIYNLDRFCPAMRPVN